MLALAALDHRGQQHQLAALGQGQHLIDHLRDGAGLEVLAVFGTARRAGTSEQQAQVVVDLGDGADRGARVVGGGLLLDGDRRRQPLDVIDVGLLHHRQELSGVGGERLHVAPLALGVERVEGQRRLARARKPGDHDQAVAGQLDVDLLEVVGACTPDHDPVHSHLMVRWQNLDYTPAMQCAPKRRWSERFLCGPESLE